jgi:acetyl esterase/lipase
MTDRKRRGNAGPAFALALGCLQLAVLIPAAHAAEGKGDASGKVKATSQRRHSYDVTRSIVYSTVGGTKLLLDAYVPNARGPHPAVLVVHGGAWRTGNKQQLSGIARALAASGKAAFAINYRLAPKHKFPAQIEDCRAAVRWIVDNATKHKVDPKRLGAIGYSAGGHLVALLAAQGVEHTTGRRKRTIRLNAVAAGGAPCDFRNWPPDAAYLAYWLGGTPRQRPKAYRDASPAAFVTSSSSPVFFYHGEKDRLVRPTTARAMAAALKRARVDTEFHLIKGAGHMLAATNRTALAGALKFLDKHLAAAGASRPALPYR